MDINWGCPVKKVVSKGAGAAILKDIPKMVRLTAAVVKAVPLPVTVKTRLGWEEFNKPIVEVAEMLQDVGVRMLSVHGTLLLFWGNVVKNGWLQDTIDFVSL